MIKEINRLLNYAIQHNLMDPRDKQYSVNLLLDVFHLFEFEEIEIQEQLDLPDSILENMLAYAVEHHLIEDTVTEKDLFDTRIMNCVMQRPSCVEHKFWEYYKSSPQEATKYYYDFSIATNYIRKSRVNKDQKWKGQSKYGELDITINLSKPEKDPKEIARLKHAVSSSYPKCAICKENEGFAGDFTHAARQSIRLISLKMNKEDWFMQYSPYVYYQDHCIILNAEHKPMQINERTFQNLLAFLDLFPHYFIGSNADLPIVGGSILSHDHYQGGCYKFTMEDAQCLSSFSLEAYPSVMLFHVKWPLSTIRLQGNNREEMIACANHILNAWISYEDEEAGIHAYTGEERHNTITPIARMKDGHYELDLVLRNNRTSEEYPLGIFHPHNDVHHIKKENIGLIEVMGLAVLPARLKTELQCVEKYLLHEELNDQQLDSLQKHKDWISHLQEKLEASTIHNITNFLQEEISKKFERVLEDCGVFKLDEQGLKYFERFIEIL